jgi:hypothetical protein
MTRAEAEKKQAPDLTQADGKKAHFDKEGRLVRSRGGVLDLGGEEKDQVAGGNPELAKFVAVGKFAQVVNTTSSFQYHREHFFWRSMPPC